MNFVQNYQTYIFSFGRNHVLDERKEISTSLFERNGFTFIVLIEAIEHLKTTFLAINNKPIFILTKRILERLQTILTFTKLQNECHNNIFLNNT